MALDKDCPCTKECLDRLNCKGCERGNAWRKKKQTEREQRYQDRAYTRYKIEKYIKFENLRVENSKKPKNRINRK